MVRNRNRKPNRLKGYDYSRGGAYFITICVCNRECLLGQIINGKMILSDIGQIANECWVQIPYHFSGVELGEYVIMPNHIHGIIIINQITENKTDCESRKYPVGNAYMRSLRDVDNNHNNRCDNRNNNPEIPEIDRTKMLIPKIIQQYKAAVSRHLNHQPKFRWQKSYYDHIIRDQISFERINRYIVNNPIKWTEDIENNFLYNDATNNEYYNHLFS